MQQFRLFIWILLIGFTLPNSAISAGGSKPVEPPPLTISPSTKDVFYINQQVRFTASGGYGDNRFSTNFGSINAVSGAYRAPSRSGTASISVRDKKGNTATYRVPVYYHIRITPTSATLPTRGNATFKGVGGVPPYKYSTNRGSVGQSNGLYTAPTSTGSSVVTVTDSRGNRATANLSIYQSLGITPTSKNLMVNSSGSFNSIGGMAPISFSTNKGTISSASGSYTAPSSAGTGIVTVSDARGARATASLNIYPVLIISPKNLTLPVNGKGTFSASGGMGTLVFSTSKGAIGSSNGLYTAPSSPASSIVTVTDSLGNKATASVTINSILALSPPSLNILIKQTSNFSATGGVPGYTFSSPFGNVNPSGVYTAPAAGGVSTVKVKDSTGVERTSNVCVFAPLNIFPVSKVIAVNNQISFSAREGCKPYVFSTDNGTIDASSGQYTAPADSGSANITITDAAKNSVTAKITINPALAMTPPPLTLPINDKYTIISSGGVGPFKYTVSQGSITDDGIFTAPGTEETVTVTIEDSTGVKRTGMICVYEPLEISPIEKLFVEGNTQTFTVIHGCKPYEFSSDLGEVNSESGHFTAPAGPATGKVTVKDLANNTVSADITVNPDLGLIPLTGILEINKALNFTASGGIPDYNFSVDIGKIDNNGVFMAPATKGLAIITLSDSAGYNKTASIDVYSPLKITPAQKELAEGDTFSFVASDGFPDYTFKTTIGNIDPSTGVLTAGSAGEGIVTVTDSKSFEATAQVIINPPLLLSPTTANVQTNKLLQFIASGGVGKYTFKTSSGGIDEQGIFTAPGSKATVTVTLTDEGGHSKTAIVNVYEPIQIIPAQKTLAPFDTFAFNASGGFGDYTFSMDIGNIVPSTGFYTAPANSGTGKVTVTDSLGNSASADVIINPALSLSPILSDLEVNKTLKFTASGGVGSYTFEASVGDIDSNGLFTAPGIKGQVIITVKDGTDHSAQATVNIFETIKIIPLEKVITIGGVFQFRAEEGLPPYVFSVDKGSINSGSGLFTAPNIPGESIVTVVGQENNPVTAKVMVNPFLTLTAPTLSMPIKGNLQFTAAGGIPSYTFKSTTGSINSNGFFTASGISGQTTISVTDSVGTKKELEICIYAPLGITPSENKTLAYGNALSFSASEGCKPYVFTASIGTIDKGLGFYTAPSSAGSALVTVTDAANNSVSTNITINPSISISPKTVTTAVNRPSSFTANDGVSPYSFTANRGEAVLMTGDYTAPASEGSDVVTVTDSFGNKDTANVTVNPDLEIDPKEINLLVNGIQKFAASGGVGPYTFATSIGVIDNEGNYTAPGEIGSAIITVTDSQGYEKTAEVEIYSSLAISPVEKLLAVKDTFTFKASGGIGPYIFSTTFSTIDANSGLFDAGEAAGTGKIKVVDSIGNEAFADIRVNTSLALDAPFALPINETLNIEDLVSGGIPGYSYDAVLGIIGSEGIFTAPGEGTRTTITVTDSSGVSVSAEICIFAPLEISPIEKKLIAGETQQFEAKEGCTPYVFSNTIGEVNAETGLFTAPAITEVGDVIVTDAANNTAKASITVYSALVVEPPPEYLETGKQVNIKATGGIPDLTYTASIGSINQEGLYIAPEEPGIATIKVTDAAGDFKTVSIIIYLPLKISDPILTLAVNNTHNFAGIDGVLPYEFSTDLGGIDSLSGLFTAPGAPGSVSVTVTDKLGNVASAVVTVNSALAINPSSASLPIERKLAFTSSGGVPPYSYITDNGEVILATGAYTAPSEIGSATVTSTDSLGNKAVANIVIGPGLAISPLNLNLVTNGTANFVASGGVSPYTFVASVGSIDNDGVYIAPSNPGPTVITVKDVDGYEAIANVVIYSPLAISPIEKVLVVGDTFVFSASGGIGPYKFSKNIGAIGEDSGLFTAPLSPGSGSVTVVDSIGNSVSAIVLVNPELTLDPKPSFLAINSTFNFAASTSGGIPPYTYGQNMGSSTDGVYTAPGLGGQGIVSVTDSVGTQKTAEFCIFAPLEIFPAEDKFLAVNNTFTFSASEGCSPYIYSASIGGINSESGLFTAPENSGAGTITVKDQANNSSTTNITINSALTLSCSDENLELGQSTSCTPLGGVDPYTFTASSGFVDLDGVYTADGLTGTITVIVTDSLNNTATAQIVVYNPLAISPSDEQSIEVDTELQFTASGGIQPYAFLLSPLHGIVDDSGLYKAPGTKGLTTVILTDDIGNTKSVNINVYASLEINPATQQLAEIESPINFTASEGVPPYTWSLDPTDGATIEGGDFIGWSEGNYTVTVTDSVGKQKSAPVTVFLPLTIAPTAVTLSAPDVASFSAAGGFLPYKFRTDIGSIDENSGVFATGSSEGTGSVTVEDFAGNTAVASVTILPPFEIIPEVASVEAGEQFIFSISGGVAPFDFSVDGGSNNGSTSRSGTNLTYSAPLNPGNYVIRGIDSLNNSAIANVTVFDGVGITPPSATLALNSTITFTGTGGAPPYTFACDKGEIGATSGEYKFTEWVLMATCVVTDKNSKTAQALINGDFPNTWIWATGYSEFNKGGILSGDTLFPGARGHSSNWADNNGNIYLQGGIGYGQEGASNTMILYYLWKYDTKINDFIALKRGTSGGAYPSGTLPATSADANPSGRYGAATWTDPTGKLLWLFGGFGHSSEGGSWGSSPPTGQLNNLWRYDIATTQWTWVSGSKLENPMGVYGTKGVAGDGHPGGRSRTAEWKDSSGNLWVFGGKGFVASGSAGYLNDMWKYDVSVNKWIWMDGSSSINNIGNYSTGEQLPKAREGAVSWVDSSGNFWMFGGSISDSEFLSDLWKYDSSKTSNRWTLIKGDDKTNQAGVYGVQGEIDPANQPGARDRAAGFTDNRGNLWLFGGYGSGSVADDPGFMNDLWRYSTVSGKNEWVHEGGETTTANSSTEILGDHGVVGMASESNWPGARSSSVFWQDSDGKFWFFGGSRTRGVEKTGGDYLNDLWKFFPE
ncbi:MAG: hypothetical protein DRQ89_02605 [Epsilonproteobacteria bacterium]|nr:MAG: hypothetical protein DRQ89_02605 [Campylobacterota bacterium]